MSQSWHEGGAINRAPATAWDKAQGLVKFEVYHWTLPAASARATSRATSDEVGAGLQLHHRSAGCSSTGRWACLPLDRAWSASGLWGVGLARQLPERR